MSDVIRLSFTDNNPTLLLFQTPASQATAEFVSAVMGAKGEPGSDGATASSFTWTQSIPLSVWTIPHNLNRFPTINVCDSLGSLIYPDISYVDSNTVQITHGSAFAGKAYLN